MKKVKVLTAMRESMARKASSAMAEVRETREELKIKELHILDLQKLIRIRKHTRPMFVRQRQCRPTGYEKCSKN